MAVGGITAAILDNLLPGSREDRGLDAWRRNESLEETASDTYDLPWIQGFLNRKPLVWYIPFLPYHPVRDEQDSRNTEEAINLSKL